MEISLVQIGRILTRTSGYLHDVTSHSLQPYAGCALGSSLCGVGCYVQHNWYITRGRKWGSFVEVRENAADAYIAEYDSERLWARKSRGRFGIFLSSSTEPFQPAERKHQVTRKVLEAMVARPPDLLIVQSHSHHVGDCVELYRELMFSRRVLAASGEERREDADFGELSRAAAKQCDLRIHVSIESDRDLPRLPPSASPVDKRFEACARLKAAGLKVIVTVSPLLPIDDPHAFFKRIAEVADACVIDHFIEGDGTATGARTRRTPLPLGMESVREGSATLEYRDEIVAIARNYLPTGVGIAGFAGKYL